MRSSPVTRIRPSAPRSASPPRARRSHPALTGGATQQAGGASLLAGAVVRVQGALLDRLVDPRDELAVLVGDRGSIAGAHGALEAPEVRLDGALQAAVLEPFAFGAVDALAL